VPAKSTRRKQRQPAFPLRWKLNLLIAGTSAGLAILLLAFLYFFAQARLFTSDRDNARERLEGLVTLITPALLTYNTSSIRFYLAHESDLDDVLWLAVFDASDRLLESQVYAEGARTDELVSLWNSRDWSTDVSEERLKIGTVTDRVWVYTLPIRPVGESVTWGYVFAGVSMRPTLREVARMRWGIIISALAAILLGWGLTTLFSRRITQPIDRLVEQTRAVAAGDLDHELTGTSNDEVGILYSSFTSMQSALKDSFEEIAAINATLEKRVEERTRQLEQLQRLESLGTLAGGIAHNFNNLLGIILGYSELLLQRGSLNPEQTAKIEKIRLGAFRGAELTEQLLGFARRGKVEVAPVDLNEIVGEITGMLTETLDPKIVLDFTPVSRLPVVEADAAQIRQMIMNLLLNARDALGPGGGAITVRLDELTPPDHVAQAMEPLAERAVRLTIGDEGCGMDEKVLDRVFEPFFTTKEEAAGLGLGLSMVYGIVKNHGGAITLFSEPGRGTTAEVFLPVGEGAETIPSDVAGLQSGTRTSGNRTVMLVDDEQEILSRFSESGSRRR